MYIQIACFLPILKYIKYSTVTFLQNHDREGESQQQQQPTATGVPFTLEQQLYLNQQAVSVLCAPSSNHSILPG